MSYNNRQFVSKQNPLERLYIVVKIIKGQFATFLFNLNCEIVMFSLSGGN